MMPDAPPAKPLPAPICPLHETPMEFIQLFDGREWFECGHATAGIHPRRCSFRLDRLIRPTAPQP